MSCPASHGEGKRKRGAAELRKRLDQVDEEIVALIARRLETVGLIARRRRARRQGIRDPEREREVLARVEAMARSLGMSAPLARKIFSELHRPLGHPPGGVALGDGRPAPRVAVAYQGAPLTYNHLAAQKFAGRAGVRRAVRRLPSIKEAVDQLESGGAELALLTIESTAAGSINQVYDVLREKDLHIVGRGDHQGRPVPGRLGRGAAVGDRSGCCRTRWRSTSARRSSTRCATRGRCRAWTPPRRMRLVAEAQGSDPGGDRFARGGGGPRADGPAPGDRQPGGDPDPLRGAGARARCGSTRASPARPASSCRPATSRARCCAACRCSSDHGLS